MSTRSNISILRADGTVTTQYYYMDGDLSFTGQRLLDNYHTLDDAESLIKMGSYDDNHVPGSPAEVYQVIDKADVKKIDHPAKENYPDLSAMISDIARSTEDGKYLRSDVEYHYLFAPNAEGIYQWNSIMRNGIVPLNQKLIEKEQEGGTLVDVDWNKSSVTNEWSAPLKNSEVSALQESISKQVEYLEHFQKQGSEVLQDQKIKDKSTTNLNKRKKSFDKEKWKKQHTQTVEELKKGLLKEVENYTQSPDKIIEMMDFMSKFHNYSERNAMLIHMQRPGATAVGSFAKFKQLGYSVNKGEKGIKIFVPTKTTVFYRQDKDGHKDLISLKNATKDEKEKIESGNIKTYSKTFYKIGTVFDAPQTNMPKEKYPELYPNRHQDFAMKKPEQLKLLENGLKNVANKMKMPVITYNSLNVEIRDKYKDPQNAKGYFNAETNEIVLNQNNTPTESVSVLAHELGHAQLHNQQKQEKSLPRELKEMQAELTSYLYCTHYGINNKKEVVNYIANWTSNGQKFNELPAGVKGQLLIHASSATKTLITSTDKVMEAELDKTDRSLAQNQGKTKLFNKSGKLKPVINEEVRNVAKEKRGELER